MTANSFVPTTLLKDLTATEYSGELDFDVLKRMTLEDFNNLQVVFKLFLNACIIFKFCLGI